MNDEHVWLLYLPNDPGTPMGLTQDQSGHSPQTVPVSSLNIQCLYVLFLSREGNHRYNISVWFNSTNWRASVYLQFPFLFKPCIVFTMLNHISVERRDS